MCRSHCVGDGQFATPPDHYADLGELTCSIRADKHDHMIVLSALGDVGPERTAATPLRMAEDRRQALVELDALVLGVTADQLCTVYRTQFAVLYGYDRTTYLCDVNGRLVPNTVQVPRRKKGAATSVEEPTATSQVGNTYTYELPFTFLDRKVVGGLR